MYDVAKDIKIAAIVKFIEARTLSNAGESSDASNLFSKNLYAFLDILIDKESSKITFEDEIVKNASVSVNGELSDQFKNLG